MPHLRAWPAGGRGGMMRGMSRQPPIRSRSRIRAWSCSSGRRARASPRSPRGTSRRGRCSRRTRTGSVVSGDPRTSARRGRRSRRCTGPSSGGCRPAGPRWSTPPTSPRSARRALLPRQPRRPASLPWPSCWTCPDRLVLARNADRGRGRGAGGRRATPARGPAPVVARDVGRSGGEGFARGRPAGGSRAGGGRWSRPGADAPARHGPRSPAVRGPTPRRRSGRARTAFARSSTQTPFCMYTSSRQTSSASASVSARISSTDSLTSR